jgi:CHAT domain-containing protein
VSDGEAAALTRQLLSPVAALLGAKRLIVVADRAMHDVPFGVLPHPKDGRPLLSSHDITLIPSASMLVALRRGLSRRPPPPKLLAVIADPVFERADVRVRADAASPSPASYPLSRRVARLPFSRDEADGILDLAPVNQRLRAVDFDASRATATGPELGEYRFVHFATHAVRDDDHPELSGILLSLVDRRGQAQDGFLRLHDVVRLKLNADVVVLSACETGLGTSVSNHGPTGLAQGIFAAGAARVVSSLWKVDDEATAELMRLFYRRLLAGSTSAAAALRDAQMAMMARPRWRDPYYWSSFVIQGGW